MDRAVNGASMVARDVKSKMLGLECSRARILSAQVVVGLRGGPKGEPGPTSIIPALAQGYADSCMFSQSRIIPSNRGVDNPDQGPLDRGITRPMQDPEWKAGSNFREFGLPEVRPVSVNSHEDCRRAKDVGPFPRLVPYPSPALPRLSASLRAALQPKVAA